VERVAKAPELSPMEASDREDAVGEWLEDHGISGGWDLAPTFVSAGLEAAWLDQVAAVVDDGMLESSIRWLNYTVETELLMNEIEDSTKRVSHLVKAAKQYSQLDRAPYQVVDVHELLKSTLMMLAGKLGDGITVVKDFDRSLPPIPGYPAELNQVWTNLIDNAVSAMDGHGTLTVRTARQDDRVLVEIGDTGPASPGTSRAGSSSRSSPPSRWERAPGSDWTSPTASSSPGITGTCESSRNPEHPVPGPAAHHRRAGRYRGHSGHWHPGHWRAGPVES